MSVFYRNVFAAAVFVAGGAAGSAALAQDAVKTVVLVHGAWADGSSWARVVPLLEAAGLNVVAVQNPLSSFEADVANTVRVIDGQPGDVILVGHSYGGMVITEAGNNPKVKALVYVAAFGPGPGQSVNAILSGGPQPEWFPLLHADAGGYVSWPVDAMGKYFASDMPEAEVRVLAATQHPTFYGVNDGTVGDTVAYATRPTWSVVSENDLIIPAQVQMLFAGGMKSTVVPVQTGHLPMFTDPEGVAAAIVTASAGY
jgi:pimeloyl-ACP methyl ester carboxylesterase